MGPELCTLLAWNPASVVLGTLPHYSYTLWCSMKYLLLLPLATTNWNSVYDNFEVVYTEAPPVKLFSWELRISA